MSAETPDSAGGGRSRSAPPPNYLYHRQRRRGADAPAGADGRDAAYRNTAQQVFATNVRKFAIVGGAMVVLLVAGMTAARISWNLKHERQTSGMGAAAAPSEPDYPIRQRGPAAKGEWTPPGADRAPADEKTVNDAQTTARRADALRDAGHFEAAADEYLRALAIWPGLTTARANLGRLYLAAEDYAKAQAALQVALEDDPGAPDVINDLGVAQLKQQHIDKALKLFESAVQMNPQFAPALYNMALCHLLRSDRARAGDAIERYLQLLPGDARGLKEKSFLSAAAGDYARAMSVLKDALKAKPDWPQLYFDAAAIAALMRNSEDAISYLKKAESLSSPAAAYLAYQQPAFQGVRATELGQAFQSKLAETARERVLNGYKDEPLKNEPEPMLAGPPTNGNR